MTHGLRSFNGAVQRRLTTLTVTMLISSCWQLLSEVELRRIFDVRKRWADSGFACVCKEKYGSIHEATQAICSLLVSKCSSYPRTRPVGLGRGFVLRFHTRSAPPARFGLLYRNILFSMLSSIISNSCQLIALANTNYRVWRNNAINTKLAYTRTSKNLYTGNINKIR